MARRKKEKMVMQRRLYREVDADGQIHYRIDEEQVAKSSLEKKAKHVTGDSKAFVVVDMDPDYPDYEKENTCNAQGFHFYYLDDRVHEGFEDLGKTHVQKALPDWKMLLVIGVFVVVAGWMLTRMM